MLFTPRSMATRNVASRGNPSLANLIAGAANTASGSVPNFLCASINPAASPGTPTARGPVRLAAATGLPSFIYNSRRDAAGAVSRKSSAKDFLSLAR